MMDTSECHKEQLDITHQYKVRRKRFLVSNLQFLRCLHCLDSLVLIRKLLVLIQPLGPPRLTFKVLVLMWLRSCSGRSNSSRCCRDIIFSWTRLSNAVDVVPSTPTSVAIVLVGYVTFVECIPVDDLAHWLTNCLRDTFCVGLVGVHHSFGTFLQLASFDATVLNAVLHNRITSLDGALGDAGIVVGAHRITLHG